MLFGFTQKNALILHKKKRHLQNKNKMLHKVFSSLPHKAFLAEKVFPAVHLSQTTSSSVTAGGLAVRSTFGTSVPLSVLQSSSSLNDASDGDIVELRSSEQKNNAKSRLLSLGFVNRTLQQLDLFHVHDFEGNALFPLPEIDETYFQRKVKAALEKRLQGLGGNSHSTCFRAFHGASDGIPGLYVDHYSSSFLAIHCETTGAERVVSAVAAFFRDRGAEQLLVSTPSIPQQVVLLVTPTTLEAKRGEYYQEGLNQFLWIPKEESDSGHLKRFLLNPQQRRTRRLLQDLANGKDVLCMGDRAAASSLASCLHAKSVTTTTATTSLLNSTTSSSSTSNDNGALTFARANLLLNHGKEVFPKVGCVSTVEEALDRCGAQKILASYQVISVEMSAQNGAVTTLSESDMFGALSKLARGGLFIVQFSNEDYGANLALQEEQTKKLWMDLQVAASRLKRQVQLVTQIPTVALDYPQPLWNGATAVGQCAFVFCVS